VLAAYHKPALKDFKQEDVKTNNKVYQTFTIVLTENHVPPSSCTWPQPEVSKLKKERCLVMKGTKGTLGTKIFILQQVHMGKRAVLYTQMPFRDGRRNARMIEGLEKCMGLIV